MELLILCLLSFKFQLGCYVPAHYAQFRITDRIFSRMGFNDSLEKNLSTFMMEVIASIAHFYTKG